MMDIALERLRSHGSPELASLARLIVDDLTGRPLRTIVHPRWLASQLQTAIEATHSADLIGTMVAPRFEPLLEQLAEVEHPVGDWVPDDVDEPLRAVLRHAWTPDVDLTMRVLDQPAMRALVAEVLTTMLVRFRKRMSNLDGGLIKSIGERAQKRSRGLFGGMAEIAGGVVGAMREEVEHGLDERVKEFVEGATRDALRAIAEHVADAEHEAAFAELRVGVLDVLLATPVKELSTELGKAKPLDLASVMLLAVQKSARAEGFVDRTEERFAQILEQVGDGTLGAWLEEAQLHDVWVSTTTEWVAERLGAMVLTDAFVGWWRTLHRDAP